MYYYAEVINDPLQSGFLVTHLWLGIFGEVISSLLIIVVQTVQSWVVDFICELIVLPLPSDWMHGFIFYSLVASLIPAIIDSSFYFLLCGSSILCLWGKVGLKAVGICQIFHFFAWGVCLSKDIMLMEILCSIITTMKLYFSS